MRTYELMFVVDPRVADEDVVAMTQDYRHMIEAGGLEITKEENWGRRKLAYTIDKMNEGKYILFYIQSQDGTTKLHEVEHRMRQNDKVLRFLTVRTDLDLKRAGSRVSVVEPPMPATASPAASPAPAGPPATPVTAGSPATAAPTAAPAAPYPPGPTVEAASGREE
ncbi:MAG: small subunit ribosomal protein [Acidobacteriota bacterium]|jgi:small subunit ribosomal protein S6|nr:small subunit ribosomal protein [Acidobacteriota bacterium]